MGNLHLVTGYAGEPHVTSADQGSLFEALIRSGQFVMEAGANFAASIVTNNLIRVSDGELMMQGRHVKLTPGVYVDLTIENGAQGFLRNDLIVVRYTRNSANGVEECSLVVLKGTPAASNPSDPQYTTGNLNADSTLQHDFPLYRVPISGLNVGELETLFTPQKSIFDAMLRASGSTMSGDLIMDGHKVRDLGTPTANGDAVPLSYANEKFAPAGFGLGTNVPDCGDCNVATKTGWYLVNSNTLNKPSTGFNYAVLEVINRQNDMYAQIIRNNNNECAMRTYANGMWNVWEWINPPMSAGVEYRTIERYQGAAVYKKVNSSGDVLWRKDGDSKWHLLTSADYISDATIE